MPSVPEHLTIIDFIATGGWLPLRCSVCESQQIDFAWCNGPVFCRHCAEAVTGEERVRLDRVQDMRRLLGFGEDDAGSSVRRALHTTLEQPPPPVVGHPIE